MIIYIRRANDPQRTWLAKFPDMPNLGWLPTPYFGPATAETVKAALESRNPQHTVIEEGIR